MQLFRTIRRGVLSHIRGDSLELLRRFRAVQATIRAPIVASERVSAGTTIRNPRAGNDLRGGRKKTPRQYAKILEPHQQLSPRVAEPLDNISPRPEVANPSRLKLPDRLRRSTVRPASGSPPDVARCRWFQACRHPARPWYECRSFPGRHYFISRNG